MIFILFILVTKIDTTEVYYTGDTLHYLWQEGIIWLTGHAELKTPDIITKADTIKYDSNKNFVTAYGNPILWVGKQEISGKKMLYDLNTGYGIIYDGRTQIQKGWFDGKIIRKVGKKVLNVDYGKFTTCNLNPPHYYFWGRRLKVYVDDMIYTKPLVLCVKGIPLFIAPFWWFPIKKGRQSGFLYPKIGKSEGEGRYVKNIAYYWVINKWSDATFIFDYFEKMGPRLLLEGRWSIKPLLLGNFNASYIVEREGKIKRGAIDFTHSQRLGHRFSLRASGNFVSDAEYKVDYEETQLVSLDKILTSYLAVTKLWDLGGVNFVVQDRKYLDRDTEEKLLPKFTYNLNSIRILGGYFSYGGAFTNSISRDKYSEKSERCSNNRFRLSFPFKIIRYLSVSPATSQNYTYRVKDLLYKSYQGSYSVTFSTNIYGRTILKPELRHIMSPRISYSWEDSKVWTGAEISTSKKKACSFSISNNFYALIGEKKWSLARLNLGSSWNFDESRVNPVSISLYSNPFPLINSRAFATYKPYDELEKFKFERLTSSYNFHKKDFSLSMTYNWVPERDQSLWGTVKMHLTKNWNLTLSRRYDLREREIVGESFSLYRDLHCWEALFNFSRYGEHWRYDFKLKLKAIPEIKVGKGIIGIFL
ncbi:LPS-assembly protein LptD [candidate division WOR-3 bacterium]|nr:LPS-assembly protein LptD [candidate division WOR-3 bacterium]